MVLSINYFKLLDLEQKYDTDFALLQKQYLQKQALYHPDRAGSDSARLGNLEISMQLNEAYKVLKDDFLRAEHLLKLLGQKFDDHDLKNKLSTGDLEAIIESHEMLESIETLEELKLLQGVKVQEKERVVAELSECFKGNNIAKALEISIGLKYLTNLVRNIDLKIKHADSRDQ